MLEVLKFEGTEINKEGKKQPIKDKLFSILIL
jgi:hypothetical protein